MPEYSILEIPNSALEIKNNDGFACTMNWYSEKKEEDITMPETTNQNITQEDTAGSSMGQLQMEAVIMQHNPERGVLASADVKIGGFMTIRNVRIKEDDYGLTVSMPRTKMPQTDQYRDSVFFADRSMKEQFDQVILNAYQNSVLMPVLNDDMPEEAAGLEENMDQEEGSGMSMGM